MARRVGRRTGAREDLAEHIGQFLALLERCGYTERAARERARLDDLAAGEPVRCQAWELDTASLGMSPPQWESRFGSVLRVESDGQLTPMRPVYRDPDVWPRTILRYEPLA